MRLALQYQRPAICVGRLPEMGRQSRVKGLPAIGRQPLGEVGCRQFALLSDNCSSWLLSRAGSLKSLFGASRSKAKKSATRKQIGDAEASSLMNGQFRGQVSLFPLPTQRSASFVVGSHLVSNYQQSFRRAQEERPTAHALCAAPLTARLP